MLGAAFLTCAAQSRSTSCWHTGTENFRLQGWAEWIMVRVVCVQQAAGAGAGGAVGLRWQQRRPSSFLFQFCNSPLHILVTFLDGGSRLLPAAPRQSHHGRLEQCAHVGAT